MGKSFDSEQLGAALNERVQQAKTREEAEAALNEGGPISIAVVADLNHLEFNAVHPRKSTMVRAILNERFGA
jgi:uncharacterized protein YgbK (DUF1537 family)